MFEVEKDGEIIQYVVDPPMAEVMGRPLTVKEWLSRMSKSPFEKVEKATETFRQDFLDLKEGKETKYYYRNQYRHLKMKPLTGVYFETAVNIRFSSLSSGEVKKFKELLEKSREDILKYNEQSRAAKLATEIKKIGIEKLTQEKVDDFKENYTKEEIAFCIQKYSGTGRTALTTSTNTRLEEKLYDGKELVVMRFASKISEKFNKMTNKNYIAFINELKDILGKSNKKEIYEYFDSDFPNLSKDAQEYMKAKMNHDFKKDILDDSFPKE